MLLGFVKNSMMPDKRESVMTCNDKLNADWTYPQDYLHTAPNIDLYVPGIWVWPLKSIKVLVPKIKVIVLTEKVLKHKQTDGCWTIKQLQSCILWQIRALWLFWLFLSFFFFFLSGILARFPVIASIILSMELVIKVINTFSQWTDLLRGHLGVRDALFQYLWKHSISEVMCLESP